MLLYTILQHSFKQKSKKLDQLFFVRPFSVSHLNCYYFRCQKNYCLVGSFIYFFYWSIQCISISVTQLPPILVLYLSGRNESGANNNNEDKVIYWRQNKDYVGGATCWSSNFQCICLIFFNKIGRNIALKVK